MAKTKATANTAQQSGAQAAKQAVTQAGTQAATRKAATGGAAASTRGAAAATRAEKRDGLVVAVTGPTGTFGSGLVPLLQADHRVRRVVGIARSPFDPADRGWTKMDYRRGDVRDEAALREAFAGADVVVHLAFLIIGGPRETTRAINVEGTLNAFRAAAAAGAKRFVYASSVAAYGFHRDNPSLMTEEWPTRPADRLFYAQEKAELEALLQDEAAGTPGLGLYLLRPPVVAGPNARGGKDLLPGPVTRLLRGGLRRLPVPLPLLVPDIPLQLVHEDDVGQALVKCIHGEGPPGAYNIAADDVLSLVDVARAAGFLPVPIPDRTSHSAARALSRLPFLPTTLEWVEAASQPSLLDSTKAREQLGWTPRYTSRETLEATFTG